MVVRWQELCCFLGKFNWICLGCRRCYSRNIVSHSYRMYEQTKLYCICERIQQKKKLKIHLVIWCTHSAWLCMRRCYSLARVCVPSCLFLSLALSFSVSHSLAQYIYIYIYLSNIFEYRISSECWMLNTACLYVTNIIKLIHICWKYNIYIRYVRFGLWQITLTNIAWYAQFIPLHFFSSSLPILISSHCIELLAYVNAAQSSNYATYGHSAMTINIRFLYNKCIKH